MSKSNSKVLWEAEILGPKKVWGGSAVVRTDPDHFISNFTSLCHISEGNPQPVDSKRGI